MPTEIRRSPLGRNEWIQEALLVLGDDGVDAVRVEPLAKRLGVTKGSFYHHFSDRDELLVAALDSWFQQATLFVIEIVNRFSRRPEERLRHLLGLAIDSDAQIALPGVELTIRGWARSDRRARSMIEAVDAKRIEYITGRLLALGCERGEAEDRSFLIYSYIMGEGQIARVDTHAVRAERVERCLARLVLDLPGVGSVEEV